MIRPSMSYIYGKKHTHTHTYIRIYFEEAFVVLCWALTGGSANSQLEDAELL